MASTRLWYLAIKKETTTAVAVKPTHFLWFKEGDLVLNQEVIANNPIRNNRWNAITPVKGKITTDGTYTFDFDINESIHFLYYLMGAISTSDIGSTPAQVYQHTFTLANTLPSFTLEQWKGNLTDATNNLQNYQVDRGFGVMVDKLSMSASDGIVSLSVDMKAHGIFQRSLLIANATAGASVALSLESIEWLVATSDTVNIFDKTPQNESDAIASISLTNKTITIATLWNSYTVANEAKVELVPQTPSYGVAKVFSFTTCSFQTWVDLTAAAAASETNIEDWEFTYENQLEERFGSLRSSPSVIAPKGAKAMIKYTKYFENVTDRDNYLALTKKALILTMTNNEVIGAADTNNFKYTLKIEMSDCRFLTYEMPTGTDELYAVTTEAECFYDSGDGRAIRMIATNSKAGTEYTA